MNKAGIRSFFQRFCDTGTLRDEDDIFQFGLVNSMFAVQLVGVMEKEFGIAVEDEDLDIENFNSVSALARFAEWKAAGAACSAD